MAPETETSSDQSGMVAAIKELIVFLGKADMIRYHIWYSVQIPCGQVN